MLELDTKTKELNKNFEVVFELKERLKRAEDLIEKSNKDHLIETTAFLHKIAKLEEVAAKPIDEDLYGKLTTMHESLKKAEKFKDFWTRVCQLLDSKAENFDDVCQKVKKLLEASLTHKKLEEISQKLCKDLGVHNYEEITDSIKQICNSNKNAFKLYEKLAELLIQCSPKNKFEGLPTCHNV